MNLPLNPAPPRIMHIDLNSCFASVEQQANPLLRGKPLAVCAYTTPNACVLAASIEAKKYGVKVGHSVRDAKQLCPNIIVLPTDPPKYRVVHIKFIKILKEYSDIVTPKSIDEAILDFNDPALHKLDLKDIGKEIKYRIKNEIGEWLRCNVGIGPSRFLAKTAAGLHKPDGLDILTHKNLLETYQTLQLLDIYGINTRYQRRLNSAGIFTTIDFFNASLQTLHKTVFKSIMGYHWYFRLRGYESDNIEFQRRTIGHEYSLKHKTADPKELAQVLMTMCEKTGRRLRENNCIARGVYFSVNYLDGTTFHHSHRTQDYIYASQDIYKYTKAIFDQQPECKTVRLMAIGCFDLLPNTYKQLELFSSKKAEIVYAMDKINDRYGEYMVTTARMLTTKDAAPDAIAFGKVREMKYD
jgi:DNA polymerase-4